MYETRKSFFANFIFSIFYIIIIIIIISSFSEGAINFLLYVDERKLIRKFKKFHLLYETKKFFLFSFSSFHLHFFFFSKIVHVTKKSLSASNRKYCISLYFFTLIIAILCISGAFWRISYEMIQMMP